MVVIFLFSLTVLGVGIVTYLRQRNGTTLFGFIVIFLILFTFGLSVADGVRSIHKFRKGYDVDISDLPDDAEEGSPARPHQHRH